MTFELIPKTRQTTSKIHKNEVSITASDICIGNKISHYFYCNGFGYVEIFMNIDDKQIGMKGSNNVRDGFKLYKRKNFLTRILSKRIAKMIPVGRYQASLKNDMWIFDVHELAIDSNSFLVLRNNISTRSVSNRGSRTITKNERKQLECTSCGHIWLSRIEPNVCPACHNNWRTI